MQVCDIIIKRKSWFSSKLFCGKKFYDFIFYVSNNLQVLEMSCIHLIYRYITHEIHVFYTNSKFSLGPSLDTFQPQTWRLKTKKDSHMTF